MSLPLLFSIQEVIFCFVYLASVPLIRKAQN